MTAKETYGLNALRTQRNTLQAPRSGL